MSASRRIAVLGPIPRDRIITHPGEGLEKYGRALYTAAALSALLDPTDPIAPVGHVRRRDEDPIKQTLSAFPNIDLTGDPLHDRPGATSSNCAYIKHNHPERSGRRLHGPILPADVDRVLDADAFVCVPITDYQVGQPTLPLHPGPRFRHDPAGRAWPD